MKTIAAALPLLLLAACGGEAPKQDTAAAAEVPVSFPAGEWEFTSTIEKLQSTDQSTPAIARAVGSSEAIKACIKDGKDLINVFPAKGDTCTVSTSYTRNGRVNTAYNCKRPGRGGDLNPTVNGNYTADTAEVTVVTSTMFSGDGDYDLTEKVTAKRLGDCPAA
jgi:hypothetical protein